MIKPEDVTIIIPHLGRTSEQRYSLEQCLMSLQETVPDMKKIIAVNGGEYDKGFYMDYKGFNILNNVEIIQLDSQGQCKAVNAAVATVNTPWVFITNDDMIYAPRWFERLTHKGWGSMMQEFDDRNLLCISPKLVEPRSGAPTFETYFCGGAGGDFDKQKFLEYVEKNQLQINGLRTGFNLPLLIKKELWDTVGGYDVNYDPWSSNSDSDLEYKIKLTGIQPYQNTNCLVYHFSQTSGTFEPRNQSYWQKNFAYFEEKWGFPRTDNGIWEATFDIPSAQEGRKYLPDWENKYGN